MARIYSTIRIQRPIEQVFNYVTTPNYWTEWHPSSLGVSGAKDHSLDVDEQVEEEFLVAGRRGRVIWTVRERKPPHQWVIDGEVGAGGRGTITYTLTPYSNEETTFEREFTYFTPNLLAKMLDWLVLSRRIRSESEESLRRLKEAIERKA
ncbi:SRPBCC family protein [Nostoc sp. UIC 10607]|uniref:SRPBCC family protein n=2 Tax=Nostoc TaxID=1177 RepID=A0ABR8IG13_9NOSO|nr:MULTISPECIES: SRPBCC family protein [Nostoc]MBD2564089.1 SRPBCC family protein [Nostoc linckia FACHB-391]MBD2649834.1 SRPBCC family protein [Nostoc foliaceum FACHB-393]